MRLSGEKSRSGDVLDGTIESNGAAPKAAARSPRKSRSSSDNHAVRAKNYVLDTNVLLHDPDALQNFQDNRVLIPIEVIEEVDKFKRETSERGQNARTVSRRLDALRSQGSLAKGVETANGGSVRIIFNDKIAKSPQAMSVANGTVDSRILALALAVRDDEPGRPTVLVTKDINLRLKADVYGLPAEDYETDQVNIKDLYTGQFELTMPASQLSALKAGNEILLPTGRVRHPNEYCTLIEEGNPKRTVLCKVDPTGTRLTSLQDCQNVWGIRPKNREQHFALDALLDDRVRLVTLMGKAGTGKTLLALAAGLKKAVTDREFRRLVVARPTIAMGKELGFLPGSLEEKLSPWMQPIHDALEMLGDLNMSHDRRTADLLRTGTIVVEALSYIRGRSIAHQFMIVDESQNLTPLEVKTILTRVGHGTKIVMTGDPYQIDNPYVDVASNGFNYVISRFREQALAAHIELHRGERSELAELAANIL
ncbi:MAG TPA: PhoH family protein [Candidatus Limnocylindria bacterium]|nr:PhoH family protein [Candidatus Limnocylindria bacterium]